jgi:hypothetical protein
MFRFKTLRKLQSVNRGRGHYNYNVPYSKWTSNLHLHLVIMFNSTDYVNNNYDKFKLKRTDRMQINIEIHLTKFQCDEHENLCKYSYAKL